MQRVRCSEETHGDLFPVGRWDGGTVGRTAREAGGGWSRGMGSSVALPSCQRWRINEPVRKKGETVKEGGFTPGGGDRAAGTMTSEEG